MLDLDQFVLRCTVEKHDLESFNPGSERVLLKEGPRPSGPKAQRPTTCDGPPAWWPSPNFPQFLCPAVNPRACTGLHQVWACKMDDGEFEFV